MALFFSRIALALTRIFTSDPGTPILVTGILSAGGSSFILTSGGAGILLQAGA